VTLVVVEQALGPGVDFERDDYGQPIGRRARTGGIWLGFDRAALPDSDDGTGRLLPVVMSLPASSFAGCRFEAVLTGGWSIGGGNILVGMLPGSPPPSRSLAAAAAGMASEGVWFGADQASRQARDARRRFRERRSQERVLGGRAWDIPAGRTPEAMRYTTPHSAAEYSLSCLPPRFLRGLSALLDDDERLLYAVQRPALLDPSLADRLRGRERRAALLALTDRQLLWAVDHFAPDRYLSDWGIDVDLIPVERIAGASCAQAGGIARLEVATALSRLGYALPAEHAAEVSVMQRLLARFVPSSDQSVPRRVYSLMPLALDTGSAARFGQQTEADSLLGRVRGRDLMAFAYSPRRPGQPRSCGLALTAGTLELIAPTAAASVSLADVSGLRLTLSPLATRFATLGRGKGVEIAFPGPLAGEIASLARLARRAMANCRESPPDQVA